MWTVISKSNELATLLQEKHGGFHMTLTGRLSPEDRVRYLTELEKRFVPAKIGAVTVDDLCVFRQESPDSDLTLLHRFALRQV